MAKLESNLKTMVLSLFGVCAVASTLLAFMNQVTEGPIAESKLKAKLEAIQLVVPEFTNNPSEEMYLIPSDLGDLECYPARRDSQLVGVAVSTRTNIAFSGSFALMVGFTPTGEIINTSVLEHKETPGLGTKMMEAKFKSQFEGKNPGTNNLKVKKDGGEIDAITAATITSRAFSDAIVRAYKSWQEGGKK